MQIGKLGNGAFAFSDQETEEIPRAFHRVPRKLHLPGGAKPKRSV